MAWSLRTTISTPATLIFLAIRSASCSADTMPRSSRDVTVDIADELRRRRLSVMFAPFMGPTDDLYDQKPLGGRHGKTGSDCGGRGQGRGRQDHGVADR